MKISQLDRKEYLSGITPNLAGENSFLVLNYSKDNADSPVTYRVSINELGRMMINNLKLTSYDSSNGNMLNTLSADSTDYTSTNVGQFVSAADRSVLDAAITNVGYDGVAKKFTQATRGGSPADVVTTAQLLTDMDLNVSDISGFSAGKTLSALSETNGKISASFQDISITSSQISDSNAANKVLKLNSSGLIDSNFLPSYVDDVIEGYFYNDTFYEEAAHTNAITGESGKIYVDLGGGRAIYRYSGSAFVEIPASPISDVQIDGTSVVSNYVATIPIGTYNNFGVFKANADYGITYVENYGILTLATPTAAEIKAGTNTYKTNNISQQHQSVFYGLAKAAGDATQAASDNAVGTYTTDAQSSIRTMIGAGTYSKPSGGIPSTDLADTYLTQHQSLSGLAPIASPAFTGSISLNRKTGTTAGTESIAVGNETAANGDQTVAFGRSTISNGDVSFTCGTGLVAAGGSEFVIGTYNKLPAQAWQPNTAYVMDDYVVYQDKLYYCSSPHTSAATFEEDSGWYHARKYLLTIGNGNNSSGRGNAFVVDIWGNAHLKGDLYIGCDDDSQGGNKVIAIPEPPSSDGTYTLQCTVASGVVTYNWVSST